MCGRTASAGRNMLKYKIGLFIVLLLVVGDVLIYLY
jgi:hypothetical protein